MSLESANERARREALREGHASYRHQVIEYWPACATCAKPIRGNASPPAGRRGIWRTCACSGVLWTVSMDGWRRVRSEGSTPT